METQKYCTIYIVRHGETQANFEEIVSGHFDSPLTEKGEEQAAQRGEALKHIKFDAVFSSDLVRAKRTAELIAADKKLAVNTHKLIRERFFGQWEGRPMSKFVEENKQLFELEKKLVGQQRQNFKPYPDYESNSEIASRMLVFLREIAATYIGKTVLAVSHGSIMRSTLMHLGFVEADELSAGSIENTGYMVLQSDGVDFFVKEIQGINKQPII